MIKPTSITALQTFFFIANIDSIVASTVRYLRENTSHNQQRTIGIAIEHRTDYGTRKAAGCHFAQVQHGFIRVLVESR
jgi:hypothetical protein